LTRNKGVYVKYAHNNTLTESDLIRDTLAKAVDKNMLQITDISHFISSLYQAVPYLHFDKTIYTFRKQKVQKHLVDNNILELLPVHLFMKR